MGASPTLCQVTHYFAQGFPGMWKSPRWVKLCHQQSLPYLKVKGGWQPFPILSPPPLREMLSPLWAQAGRISWHAHTVTLLTCTRQTFQVCTLVVGMYPEQSPSEPRRAQSRGHSEIQAAQQDPAQAVCPARHCWEWVHPFNFKPKIRGYPLYWISSFQEAAQLK